MDLPHNAMYHHYRASWIILAHKTRVEVDFLSIQTSVSLLLGQVFPLHSLPGLFHVSCHLLGRLSGFPTLYRALYIAEPGILFRFHSHATLGQELSFV